MIAGDGGLERVGLSRPRQRSGSGVALVADRSVLKRNADEIALPPDHAAFANVVKIVEGQFEIQGQQIEVVKFNSSPGIRDILNAAGENTALRVKEQQRVFRNRRPCDRPAFEFHSRPPTVHEPWRAEVTELSLGGNQVRYFS
nr:hypothetical protein [Bradyrhizobium icense]